MSEDHLPQEEIRVEVGPYALHTTIAGAGPPVVLVHGLGTSRLSWKRNLEQLSRCARVYAPDLPGFGGSEGPWPPLPARGHAEVLAGWCRAIGLERAAFVGHSMGGEVILWLAIDQPAIVSRLVLAASTGGSTKKQVWRRFGRLILDGAREPASFLPTLIGAYWKAGPWTIYRTAHATDPAPLLRELHRIEVPTLVAWGDRDPVISREEAEHMAHRLPAGRLAVIEGGAHGLIFDAPEAFNGLVCEFLELPGPMETGRAPDGARPDEACP